MTDRLCRLCGCRPAAAVVGEPEHRLASILRPLQDVLNVEGFAVLSLQEGGDTESYWRFRC